MRYKSSLAQTSARVQARRHALHLSLRQCAASVGLNTGTLAAIEQGRTTSPSTDHLVRIASFLNLSLDELLHMEDWCACPAAFMRQRLIYHYPTMNSAPSTSPAGSGSLQAD